MIPNVLQQRAPDPRLGFVAHTLAQVTVVDVAFLWNVARNLL